MTLPSPSARTSTCGRSAPFPSYRFTSALFSRIHGLCRWPIRCLAAEEIQIELPVLTLPDIYAVLSYYLSHREALRAYLNERRSEADRLRAEVSAGSGQSALRDRLLARLQRGER